MDKLTSLLQDIRDKWEDEELLIQEYSRTEGKTALDVLNTVKKYKNNSLVSVVDGNGSPYNEEALKRSLNVENAGTGDLSVNSTEASKTYSSTIKRDNNKVTIILKEN